MIQHIDATGLGNIFWRKGTDDLYNAILTNNDGTPLVLTGATITFEVYTESNKGGTNVSLTGAIVNALGGHATYAISATEVTIIDELVGADLYVYAKVIESGLTVHIADNPLTLRVK